MLPTNDTASTSDMDFGGHRPKEPEFFYPDIDLSIPESIYIVATSPEGYIFEKHIPVQLRRNEEVRLSLEAAIINRSPFYNYDLGFDILVIHFADIPGYEPGGWDIEITSPGDEEFVTRFSIDVRPRGLYVANEVNPSPFSYDRSPSFNPGQMLYVMASGIFPNEEVQIVLYKEVDDDGSEIHVWHGPIVHLSRTLYSPNSHGVVNIPFFIGNSDTSTGNYWLYYGDPDIRMITDTCAGIRFSIE